MQLARRTLNDAQLVQRLMFKLQIWPLTKHLTYVAGDIWSHTLGGNRAEHYKYPLLHEFHQLKFLPPEKKKRGETSKGANNRIGTSRNPCRDDCCATQRQGTLEGDDVFAHQSHGVGTTQDAA